MYSWSLCIRKLEYCAEEVIRSVGTKRTPLTSQSRSLKNSASAKSHLESVARRASAARAWYAQSRQKSVTLPRLSLPPASPGGCGGRVARVLESHSRKKVPASGRPSRRAFHPQLAYASAMDGSDSSASA